MTNEGNEDGLMRLLKPVDSVFEDLRKVVVLPASDKMLLNGNKLAGTDFEADPLPARSEHFRVYHPDGSFAAVYEYDGAGSIYRPVKMF